MPAHRHINFTPALLLNIVVLLTLRMAKAQLSEFWNGVRKVEEFSCASEADTS